MPTVKIVEYFPVEGSKFTKPEADVIGPQLQELAQEGNLKPSEVVEAARSKNSPLHSFFEWDDTKAADLYRVGQAKQMITEIQIKYTSDGEEQTSRAFKVRVRTGAPHKEGHHADDGTEVWQKKGPERLGNIEAAKMMDQAIKELRDWKRTYQIYIPIWQEYLEFRTLLNQIEEFEQETNTTEAPESIKGALDDLANWRDRHGRNASLWSAFAEDTKYLFEAIDTAIKTVAAAGKKAA